MFSKTAFAIGLMVFAFAVEVKAEQYDVFLLAGQSNMDGRGNKKELIGELAVYAEPQPDVLIAFASGGLYRRFITSNGFVPLAPGNAFGPEVSFGRAMAAGLPGRHIRLIKYAEGGTNLRADWNPNAKEKLYTKFIAFTRQSLQAITDHGDTWQLRGMIWHQGESDVCMKANKYQDLLKELIDRVRADLEVKDLPFVVGEVFDNGKRDSIREAQQAIAKALPGVYFVSSQGLKTFDRGTHFDAASQIEFGRRYAEPLLKLLAPPKTGKP